jgi:imidazolonepropionase-like amidohydrolase
MLFAAAICVLSADSAFSQSYAITNAKIVTVSGATIDKGTVVIRGGVIVAVGANVAAPADAQVFDASGLTVYPGFIDTYTNVGYAARPATQGGGPGGQATAAAAAAQAPTSNSNYPAGLRPEDTAFSEVRAGESQFDAIRNSGITTVVTTGRTGIFTGRSVVINLAGDNVASMVVKDPFAQHINYTTLGGTYPQSLLGTFAAIRQAFYDAARLQTWQKNYAANPSGMQRPPTDRSLEALFDAVNGKMPVVFNANDENAINRSLDLIAELNLKGIIAGGQEAYKSAARLKQMNVPVLLSLNFPKRTTSVSPEADPESLEVLRFRSEVPKTAGKLAAAGVKFAFQSGGAANMADYFANAGKAVENGLAKDAAVRAMTLGAAELLGIADRTGSLDVGKIANVVVVKGDLLGRDKFVTHVFVDGKYFEQKEPPKAAPTAIGTVSPAAANISGSYAINVEIPGSPTAMTLNLTQSGTSLTGTLASPMGSSPMTNGKVDGTSFSFKASVPYGGQNIDIDVNGKVAGQQISGSIDTAMGSIPFSGTKNP